MSTRSQECLNRLEVIAFTSGNKGRYEALSAMAEIGNWKLLPILTEIAPGVKCTDAGHIFFLTLRVLWMATIIYATVHTALMTIVAINPAYTSYISILFMLLTSYLKRLIPGWVSPQSY